MKITHICLLGPFSDGWNYQENLLSKYQHRSGYEVDVITSHFVWNANGKIENDERTFYTDEYGVNIHRLNIKGNQGYNFRLKRFSGLYELLDKISPDILFIHGCQFRDISTIVRFLKKNTDVVTFVDNHADLFNSATTWLSKNVLHKIIWRHYAKKINPFVKKWYGVLPARVDFLKDVYGLPNEKIECLSMGADDDFVRSCDNKEFIDGLRKKYCVEPSDMLIVSGGKTNEYRPEIIELMAAVKKCENDKIKLIVFGSVSDNLKEVFQQYLLCPNIIFIGWLNAKDTYAILKAADVVCFPGLHSVMWEQTVALGVPCIFRDIEGFHHIDIGGNAIFLKNPSEMNLKKEILDLFNNSKKMNKIKVAALSDKRKKFLYSKIAMQSIQQNC